MLPLRRRRRSDYYLSRAAWLLLGDPCVKLDDNLQLSMTDLSYVATNYAHIPRLSMPALSLDELGIEYELQLPSQVNLAVCKLDVCPCKDLKPCG